MGKLTEWLVGHAAELKGLAPRLAPLRVPAAEHELTLPRGRHPGSRRRTFLVRTPVGHDGTRPAPLVMVLHGCLQDHRDIQSISNFDYVADRCGFVTVYPFVTSYRDRRLRHCWGWWRSSEIQPGRGEVQDLWEIVEQV